MANMVDLVQICEVLQATQLPDSVARKAGEQRLEEAIQSNPNQLVRALTSVLAAASNVGVEVRQEAMVILRQMIKGSAGRTVVWEDLDAETRKGLLAQLLCSVQNDSAKMVKRCVGQVISAIVEVVADDFAELMKEWPECLPTIPTIVSNQSSDPSSREVCLHVLRDIAGVIGEELMEKQGDHTSAMITMTLNDPAANVRAAGAELTLRFVEILPMPSDVPQLLQVFPAVIKTVQGFADTAEEDALKDTLEALVSTIDEEPGFFKGPALKDLWDTLVKIASSGATFANENVRHGAMEALMSLAVNLSDDFSTDEGRGFLEELITLNFEWLREVEEDINVWTEDGKETGDEDCDDEVTGIAEENFDRLAENFDEEVFMPSLYKQVRACLSKCCDWKSERAAVQAIGQVVEHVEEDWVDQCVDWCISKLTHEHVRVRATAWDAIMQIAADHSPYVQEKHAEKILPLILGGISDANDRVNTSSLEALGMLGDNGELDSEDIEVYLDPILTGIFTHLGSAQASTNLKATCLSCVGVIAEIMEELFIPYYIKVVPLLKQVIANTYDDKGGVLKGRIQDDKDSTLRGKAFECISVIGEEVGKETFASDAHEVMQVMVKIAQAGIAADDPQRESIQLASGRIASILEKDFKPYVPALLPIIFATLGQRPTEIDEDEYFDDENPEDFSLTQVGDKLIGLKTSALEEMKDALALANEFIDALKEDYCEFMPGTCQALVPLLEFNLSEELRQAAFKTWERLAESAREGVQKNLIPATVLQELVTSFLSTVCGAMKAMHVPTELEDEEYLSLQQARAVGVAGVVAKAGTGVLTKDVIRDIAAIMFQMLCSITIPTDEKVEHGRRRKAQPCADADSDDEDEDENEVDIATRQSLRFCLAEVVGALMRSSPESFIEVALAEFIQLVQKLLASEVGAADKAQAFYITEDVVDVLGQHSVPQWNRFMNEALAGVTDPSPVVRQYAANTLGQAAKVPIFGQMVPAACTQIHKVLQQRGERHRRRRAVKAEDRASALSVDACIKALGEICAHHEQSLGANAAAGWTMWLSNLPLKEDAANGQQAHSLLFKLVLQQHALLTSAQHMPAALAVFASIHRTKFSTTELDTGILDMITKLGESQTKHLQSSLPETQQKKVEHLLKCAVRSFGGA